jgi:hypothetical protein
MRHIDGFRYCFIEAGLLHVADDADDLSVGEQSIVRRTEVDLLPDGAPPWPEATLDCLTHQHCPLSFGTVIE